MTNAAPIDFLANRSARLFLVLGGLFIANAIIAETIGVKIFSLEQTFGFAPANFSLLGEDGLAFDLSVGVVPWPVVFVMTDIINEYYGVKGVRFFEMVRIKKPRFRAAENRRTELSARIITDRIADDRRDKQSNQHYPQI